MKVWCISFFAFQPLSRNWCTSSSSRRCSPDRRYLSSASLPGTRPRTSAGASTDFLSLPTLTGTPSPINEFTEFRLVNLFSKDKNYLETYFPSATKHSPPTVGTGRHRQRQDEWGRCSSGVILSIR